jgi:eukaryotic-like serine/threonine-protein kinase
VSPLRSPACAELPLADRRQIDAICDQFEAAWRADEWPDIGAYLEPVADALRPQLFRELLALDLGLRERHGDPPDAALYRALFPEYLAIIDSEFTSAGSSEPTRIRTTSIVPNGLPDAGRRGGRAGDPNEALASAGYQVLDELGRGGMGIVYRAHQVALNRLVALKVIKAGEFATESQRRRFRNEAEAVARLDHPHIVPIHDVGQRQGLHYFSMKLISGSSLARRLSEFAEEPRKAAHLVATVAEAIHHAHQRGILHRDIKPANILLDEQGEPHVTDFGLARRLDVETEQTDTGAIVGTPAYMAPEQASGLKDGLTTATDIYGLGAILYALLTGRAPHGGTTFIETLDQVRDAPPEPPSKRNRRVPRDLEIVCLKCLEKAPKQRYGSARELADDLSRWLAGLPITARRVGMAGRMRMWSRRHPLPAALAALLVVSIVGGFAGVTWKWRQVHREAIKSARLVDFLAHRVLAESSTEVNPRGNNVTVREMLDRAASRIGYDFESEPDVEAAIRETVGNAYLSLGEYDQAELHLRVAIKLDTQLHGAEHPTTLAVVNRQNFLLAESGRATEAEPLLRQNLQSCRRVLGTEHVITLEAADLLGSLLRRLQQRDEAELLLRPTLAARRRRLPQDHPDTLRTIRNLCLLLADRARFREADELAHEYEHGIRCARGPKHPDNVAALANRGLIRLLEGKPGGAEPYYRQALEASQRILGADHPVTVATASELARVVRDLEATKRAGQTGNSGRLTHETP